MPTAALLLIVSLAPSQAPQPELPPAAQAYYEFMLARHLEAQGDEDGTLAALKRAIAADPKSAELRAEIAGFYARQGKAAEAVAAGEEALARDPNSPEAHRILGLVYAAWSDGGVTPPPGRVQADLRREALDHLTRILDTPAAATDLSLQVTVGRLHMRAGQPEKAIPVLENVVSQAPFSIEPYTLLSDARLAVGRVEEAADALEMAAQIDPRRYATLGELYERLGRWAEAADAYSNAVAAVRSPSRDLRLRLVSALLNIPGRRGAGRARDLLKEFLAANPQDARALYLSSAANRAVGDFPAAEDAARKLLALDPTNVMALYSLSQVFLAQRDPRKVVDLLSPFARDVASRAKGREEDAALVVAQLGLAHLQLNEPQQALTSFAAAKTLAPDDPLYDAYVVQGHIAAKQFPRAAELAATALTRFPRDERLVQLRADALAGAGRLDEAAAVLQELVDREPRNASALNSLGYLLADHGVRLIEAVRLIERALAMDPDNPAYLDSLGWALFKQGRVDEAEPPLRKAADALADESVIQDHLGDVLARRGKHEEAIVAWERALQGTGESIDRAAIEKKIKDARSRKR